jgi:hypothetical protein
MPTAEELNETVKSLDEKVSTLDKSMSVAQHILKDFPAVIAEQSRMAIEQARTNQILTDVSTSVVTMNDSLKWITRLILGGFATAMLGLVLKIHP